MNAVVIYVIVGQLSQQLIFFVELKETHCIG